MTLFARARRAAWYALLLRCPACGGRPVFTSWFHMLSTCPVCGIRFERGERGYWLGAYFANLVIMETIFVLWFGSFLWITWPDPPWGGFLAGTIALMAIVPFAAFPWSRTLFLAFDFLVRAPEEEDFVLPREQSPRGVRNR